MAAAGHFDQHQFNGPTVASVGTLSLPGWVTTPISLQDYLPALGHCHLLTYTLHLHTWFPSQACLGAASPSHAVACGGCV
jgi:hypothetical protein